MSEKFDSKVNNYIPIKILKISKNLLLFYSITLPSMNMTWGISTHTAMPLPSYIPHFERDRLAEMQTTS